MMSFNTFVKETGTIQKTARTGVKMKKPHWEYVSCDESNSDYVCGFVLFAMIENGYIYDILYCAAT